MRVELTDREVERVQLEGETLRSCVEAIHSEGYVVLGRAVDVVILESLRARLERDTIELLRRMDQRGEDYSAGHVSQPLPRTGRDVHRQIVANPFVVEVTRAVLGSGVHNHFYNGNTNLPGSVRQPLHRDAPHLWPDPIHPVISLIVNIALTDVDLTNGAMELWPGTQQIVGSTAVTEDAEAERRVIAPPLRVITRLGDVLLRDPRLWHRGMPNPGTAPRHLIAMVHSKWFYRSDTTIPMTHGAHHAFEHEVLTTRIAVVPDDYDHLSEVVSIKSW